MVYIFTFFILVCVFVLLQLSRRPWALRSMKEEDPSGKATPTMFDVRRLIQQGKIEQAKKIYCEIFQTDLTEADKAVKELERSIHK